MIPVHDTLNAYHFVPISETLKDNLVGKKEFSISILKGHLDTLIKPGMETINVNWEYKGEEFSSICVVNKGGSIVYENLMSNVFTFSFKTSMNIIDHQAFHGKVVALDSYSEPPPTSSIQFYFSDSAYLNSFWGNQVAYAFINIVGTGSIVGGKNSITSYTTSGQHVADAGYSSDAKVSVTSFVPGTNGSFQYNYGVMTSANGGGLTLGYTGSSFTMPAGASSGRCGSGYVTPAMFH